MYVHDHTTLGSNNAAVLLALFYIYTGLKNGKYNASWYANDSKQSAQTLENSFRKGKQ